MKHKIIKIPISSFAKLNLFLYVVSKRKDGYHELYSLMTCIDLHDKLYLNFSAKEISVSCNHNEIPEDESNLAFKAARLFYDSLKESFSGKKGVSIHIDKRIPPGGGLGGGSSNAASVLLALNEYYGYPFTQAELMALGLCIGADVPFFIAGWSAAVAEGIGERLTRVPSLYPYYIVLCDPGISASTAQVYKNLNFNLTSQEKYHIYAQFDRLIRGQQDGLTNYLNENYLNKDNLIKGDQKKTDLKKQMLSLLHNDLEEPACRLYPEINKTKKEMELLLHKKVHMTGSGSSLFALFSDYKNAEKGYRFLLDNWSGSKRKVFLSSFK